MPISRHFFGQPREISCSPSSRGADRYSAVLQTQLICWILGYRLQLGVLARRQQEAAAGDETTESQPRICRGGSRKGWRCNKATESAPPASAKRGWPFSCADQSRSSWLDQFKVTGQCGSKGYKLNTVAFRVGHIHYHYGARYGHKRRSLQLFVFATNP
jgi:hypothetical protein